MEYSLLEIRGQQKNNQWAWLWNLIQCERQFEIISFPGLCYRVFGELNYILAMAVTFWQTAIAFLRCLFHSDNGCYILTTSVTFWHWLLNSGNMLHSDNGCYILAMAVTFWQLLLHSGNGCFNLAMAATFWQRLLHSCNAVTSWQLFLHSGNGCYIYFGIGCYILGLDVAF